MDDKSDLVQGRELGDSVTIAPITSINQNDYIVLGGRPCTVVEFYSDGMMIDLVGRDIMSGRTYEDRFNATQSVYVPFVKTDEYQLIGFNDGYLSLHGNNGMDKNDVRIPHNEVGREMERKYDNGEDLVVTVISALGEDEAVRFRSV
ncbi:eukaryotic translation initiation factor 5A-1 [Aspergillus avenaceus]|uniref:Eukaryotic translation initiation factor 5A-1 n=1 Tax=Aspergillus avenaceus TaxID=36643 RepID=A0A5N6U7H0_ASPAV|nr:eukaryotic translation initiation factor 5A-1 [Aspergillus avenaceus]